MSRSVCFPQSFIDDLRLQANIVQVVQEYVPLKRAGTTYKGLCPFHSREDAVVQRQSGQGVLPLLRLRRRRRRLQVPRAAREGRLPGRGAACSRRSSASSLPEPADGVDDDARRDSALREALLKVHEMAAALLPRAAARRRRARARAQQLTERGVERRRRSSSSASATRRQSRDGLKARLLTQGFAQGAAAAERAGRAARRAARWSIASGIRLMMPICRDTRIDHRLRRPAMDADQAAEVSEFARDADLFEEPDAVRPASDEAGHPQARIRRAGRGLFRLRAGVPERTRRRSSPRAARR